MSILYTTDANGYLGYAYYPDGSAGASYDGVVLLSGSVGSEQHPGKKSASLSLTTLTYYLSISSYPYLSLFRHIPTISLGRHGYP